MSLLDRYIGGTFLRLFTLSIMATPPLFILGDLTDNLDDYLDRGLSLGEVSLGFLYKFPQFFTWSFPIAGLIAAVFTVHGMTVHREVVAAKAGGVSFHRLFLPVFVLGSLITVVGLGLAEIVPRANRDASDILQNRVMNRTWNQDFALVTENGYTVSVQRLTTDDRRMTGLTLIRRDGESQIHIRAAEAVWMDDQWSLVDGTYRHIPEPGSEYAVRFERLALAGLNETPEELVQEVGEPEEMTREEILRQARIAERAGSDTQGLMLELQRRLAIPVATVVIILFGAPLATTSKRGGAAFGIGVSLGSTIFYLLLLKVFGALGESGTIPVVWAAWTPNLVFAIAGLSLLSRVRT